jgi:DNA-binding response OmpR family regulator
MTNLQPTLLVADDEPFALSFITTLLEEASYRVITAKNGLIAWELLKKNPEDYDAIILDRMMPGMTGIKVLARIRNHDALKMTPVIFQTSMSENEDILEGFQAGVDYYLTKPYNQELLLCVVKSAIYGRTIYKSMQDEIRKTTDALRLMRSGVFEYGTMEEGQTLATLLATVCPEPNKAVLGLWELMLNAIEHGNLGITYEDKSRLIEKDEWIAEVNRRINLPENISKKVWVQFGSSETEIRFLIQDQGAGFDWRSFMELKPERAFDAHGRGIYLARNVSFDRIRYEGAGNQVIAIIYR